MEKIIKDKIIENFYKISRKYFSEKIIIDDSIIEEIFKDQETLYGTSEKETKIFKTSIGMCTNGKKISQRATNEKLGLKISKERTRQILEKVLQIIYEENAKITIEKAKEDSILKDRILNQPLELIGLENRETKYLKECGCNTLKELLSVPKQETKKYDEYNRALHYNFRNKINKFIENIGLEFEYEQHEISNIKEDIENKTSLQQLYKEKVLLEQCLESLDKDYYEICNLIDKIITSLKLNKELKCLADYLIKKLEEKQNKENEIIKIKEQIEKINNEVSGIMEQTFSEKPKQYIKKPSE